MKRITDWPLWGQLALGAGILTTFVGVLEAKDALADRFPSLTPASHAYVDGLFDAMKATQVAQAANLQWDQTIDRYNTMLFELKQERADSIRLGDELKENPGDNRRVQLLKETDDSIAFKVRQTQLLKCQIEKHNLGIDSC